MAKFYAVKQGRKVGIFNTWAECKAQVDGYSGAQFKSFPTKEAALSYLGSGEAPPADNSTLPSWYVDGSYNVTTKEYAFGAVLLYNGEEKTFSRRFERDALASMRNVAGEILGASFAMEYSVEHGFREIAIYYDYTGIENWALGNWKANLDGTKRYQELYKKLSPSLMVHFCKVKGHSGDKYNDLADRLAKDALGIK